MPTVVLVFIAIFILNYLIYLVLLGFSLFTLINQWNKIVKTVKISSKRLLTITLTLHKKRKKHCKMTSLFLQKKHFKQGIF